MVQVTKFEKIWDEIIFKMLKQLALHGRRSHLFFSEAEAETKRNGEKKLEGQDNRWKCFSVN